MNTYTDLKPLRAKRASTLLAIALRDFKKAYARPDVRIDMSRYAIRHEEGTCTVCLAGACLLPQRGFKSLSLNYDLVPGYELGADLRSQMWAINYLRCGRIDYALQTLGLDIPDALPTRVSMVDWEDTAPGRRRFYAYINRLIKLLRRHGV